MMQLPLELLLLLPVETTVKTVVKTGVAAEERDTDVIDQMVTYHNKSPRTSDGLGGCHPPQTAPSVAMHSSIAVRWLRRAVRWLRRAGSTISAAEDAWGNLGGHKLSWQVETSGPYYFLQRTGGETSGDAG